MIKQECPKIGQQDSPKISIENLKKLFEEIGSSTPNYSKVFPAHNQVKYPTVREFCNKVSSYASENVVKNVFNLLSKQYCNDNDEIMFVFGETNRTGLKLDSVMMKFTVDLLNNIE